jgi:exonuclease VII small subunit
VFWRLFSPQKQKELPKVGGKPVYIGGMLFLGTAERGEFDVRRHKLVALHIRDSSGLQYKLDTSDVRVKISKESIDLEISAVPKFFEIKIRELNDIVKRLGDERRNIEDSYRKLEEALIRGSISMQIYEDSKKRIAEKEKRLIASCMEAERSFVKINDDLKRLLSDVESKREALEAKRLLDRLDRGEEDMLANLIALRTNIMSIEQMLNTLLLQLRLVC